MLHSLLDLIKKWLSFGDSNVSGKFVDSEERLAALSAQTNTTILSGVSGVEVPFQSKEMLSFLSSNKIDLANPVEASRKLLALRPTAGFVGTFGASLSLTRNKTIDLGEASNIVASVTDLSLSRDVVLTLKSNNPGAVCILNIKRNFSLTSARITLQGIKRTNVLFNYCGKSAPRLSTGSTMYGSILSVGKPSITNFSTLYGTVIGSIPIVLGESQIERGPITYIITDSSGTTTLSTTPFPFKFV